LGGTAGLHSATSPQPSCPAFPPLLLSLRCTGLTDPPTMIHRCMGNVKIMGCCMGTSKLSCSWAGRLTAVISGHARRTNQSCSGMPRSASVSRTSRSCRCFWRVPKHARSQGGRGRMAAERFSAQLRLRSNVRSSGRAHWSGPLT